MLSIGSYLDVLSALALRFVGSEFAESQLGSYRVDNANRTIQALAADLLTFLYSFGEPSQIAHDSGQIEKFYFDILLVTLQQSNLDLQIKLLGILRSHLRFRAPDSISFRRNSDGSRQSSQSLSGGMSYAKYVSAVLL